MKGIKFITILLGTVSVILIFSKYYLRYNIPLGIYWVSIILSCVSLVTLVLLNKKVNDVNQ
jgi:hypothetical protein